MRAFIYSETTFRIYKNRGGRFIPQHKSPYASTYEAFVENGLTVNRARRSDAEKFIQRKAKVENPIITFFDAQLDQVDQGVAPRLSVEDANMAVLKAIQLQTLEDRLSGDDLTIGACGEQIVLQQKQDLLSWFASHNIEV